MRPLPDSAAAKGGGWGTLLRLRFNMLQMILRRRLLHLDRLNHRYSVPSVCIPGRAILKAAPPKYVTIKFRDAAGDIVRIQKVDLIVRQTIGLEIAPDTDGRDPERIAVARDINGDYGAASIH